MKTWGYTAAALLGVLAILPAVAQDDEAAERKRLEGVWSGWVVNDRGQQPDRGAVQLELTFSKDRVKASDREGVLGEATYRLSPKSSPATLDGTALSGKVERGTSLGIYSLEGDTLKWCAARPGRKRPTEFIMRVGSGWYYMVLKRKPDPKG